MTREYETIAALWQSFHQLMRGHHDDGDVSGEGEQAHGLPGTGGHVLAGSKSAGNDVAGEAADGARGQARTEA